MRTLLIGAIIFIAARYAYKLFWPSTPRQDAVGGNPRAQRRAQGNDQIEDVDFRELDDK